jgi:hypothetical protein
LPFWKVIISRISLLYDALREILETIALEKGFKIYNHECYTPFLKEILCELVYADTFDKLRKTRNSINYYGKKLTLTQAQAVLVELRDMISYLRKYVDNPSGV